MEKDVGVLLGSSANFVFYEMVEIFPGAKALYEAIIGYGCDCGDAETCGRQAFQLVVNQASNGNHEIAEKFIAEAAEKGIKSHAEVRELMVHYFHQYVAPEEENEQIIKVASFEELVELLGGALGGRSLQ